MKLIIVYFFPHTLSPQHKHLMHMKIQAFRVVILCYPWTWINVPEQRQHI